MSYFQVMNAGFENEFVLLKHVAKYEADILKAWKRAVENITKPKPYDVFAGKGKKNGCQLTQHRIALHQDMILLPLYFMKLFLRFNH